jgi:hypothetical protein
MQIADQIWALTAFSDVPKKALMRRCCLIHLKNSSTCQRYLYSLAMVMAGKAKLLVRNTSVLPVANDAARGDKKSIQLIIVLLQAFEPTIEAQRPKEVIIYSGVLAELDRMV